MATANTSRIIRDTLATFDVRCSKGTYIAKREYFYRVQSGFRDTADMADAIKRTLAAKGVVATITETADKFHAWPKDSWFEVRFTVQQ